MSDDLISRQAAIDALLHNQEVYSNNFGTDAIDKYTIAIIDNDVQTIAQLPSAEQRGKWIPKSERWHCSLCDGIAPKGIRWEFCPNCGADMRGADDE